MNSAFLTTARALISGMTHLSGAAVAAAAEFVAPASPPLVAEPPEPVARLLDDLPVEAAGLVAIAALVAVYVLWRIGGAIVEAAFRASLRIFAIFCMLAAMSRYLEMYPAGRLAAAVLVLESALGRLLLALAAFLAPVAS